MSFMVLFFDFFNFKEMFLDFKVLVEFTVCRVSGMVLGVISGLTCLTLIFVDV